MKLTFSILVISSFLISNLYGYNKTEKPSSGTLIVGGTELPKGKFTHLAGMRGSLSGKTFCGGTVISNQHILTAAHCADGIRAVALSTIFSKGKKQDGIYIKVQNVTIHPLYDDDTMEYDFAIITLEDTIPEDSNVVPALLANPDLSDEAPGTMANVHGWGVTSSGGNQPSRAMQVDIPLLANDRCRELLQAAESESVISDSMICAGGQTEDSCQMDSGGPLIVNKDQTPPTLVGVVSWGIGCGTPNQPGVYARVSYVKDFIDEHVTGHTWSQ